LDFATPLTDEAVSLEVITSRSSAAARFRDQAPDEREIGWSDTDWSGGDGAFAGDDAREMAEPRWD